MAAELTTSEKILEAGRQLFNARGYAATSLADIASVVGISKGNLSYHFPTKQDLALQLRANARQRVLERKRNQQPGDVSDDYIEHLLFAMDITWNYRFLLRDVAEFADEVDSRVPELAADFDELLTLIRRIESAGMFRRQTVTDLTVLTRSIWIVSRYWMDYLREFEGQQEISWADQKRGIRHHFAVLLPCLTASARKEFAAALARAPRKPASPEASDITGLREA
jgi:AcrR family transcriptional regulator